MNFYIPEQKAVNALIKSIDEVIIEVGCKKLKTLYCKLYMMSESILGFSSGQGRG